MGLYDNFNYQGYLSEAILNYKTAINYYKTQKTLFMTMLNETNKEALKINSQTLLLNLSQEVESQFDTGEFGNKTTEFYNKIEEMAMAYLNSSSQGGLLKTKLNEIQKDQKKQQELAYKKSSQISDKIKTQIEKTLTAQQLAGLKTRINNLYSQIYGIRANSASTSAGYGMFRRALIKEFTNKSYVLSAHFKGGYTKLLGGYYAETAIANVFSKWADQSAFKVKQVGSSGGKTDVAVGLGNIIKQLEDMETLTNNGVPSDEHLIPALLKQNYDVFGIQSKSWGIPEGAITDRRGNYSQGYMSVGEDKALWSRLSVSLKKVTPYRGWHYNAYQISKNMLSAIGPANVMYRLKNNKMIWTHELIEDLTAKKYYLTFWFTHKNKSFKYPATTELSWQKVDNRMEYAKKSH